MGHYSLEMELGSSSIDFGSLPDPLDKFELLHVIGEGNYGRIHLGAIQHLENEPKVAVKILENLEENLDEAEREYFVLKELSLHPNLPFFHGLFFKASSIPRDSQLWFVMEHCSGGTLTDLSQGLWKYGSRHLTELQISFILCELIDALLHLHGHNVIHRDVKGRNILLTEDGRIKLIDFGNSAILQSKYEKRKTSTGSPLWMSPEVITCESYSSIAYDSRCDVWSLGIATIEIADGQPPLAELHPMRALFQIPRNPPPTLKNPCLWSHDFNDFIAESLVKDIELRPWMAELKNHPFITQRRRQTEEEMRASIAHEIQFVRTMGTLKVEPEVTLKHGKLKENRTDGFKMILMDDLVALANWDEKLIVDQIQQRFQAGNVYTYIGDILIFVNPFQNLGIYTDFYHLKYRGCSVADDAPHIFGMADQTYHSMLHQKKPQVLILLGESGSGKSESCRHLLQQLVYLGQAPRRNLEKKILGVNPIIEAFGNRRTRINPNATRFAKYLNVTFSSTGKVAGMETSVYMLEDSRVTCQEVNEGGFHVFSYVLHGLSADDAEIAKIFKKEYRYLSDFNGGERVREAVEAFHAVQNSFTTIGFSEEEINSVVNVLIGILHLGELEFGLDDKGECILTFGSKNDLEIVSRLLGISQADMSLGLTTSSSSSRVSIKDAEASRDALARQLYVGLFHGIVHQINALLAISSSVYHSSLGIGILDMFGFESYATNSLEQLIVNTFDEMIQYFFNKHVFLWEQEEYKAEGINVEVTKYADNKPILDLLLGYPLSVFTILDSESDSIDSTDATLRDQLVFNLHRNKYFRKCAPSDSNTDFSIRHYAGKTTYNLTDFLIKNRPHPIKAELMETLKHSSNRTVRAIFIKNFYQTQYQISTTDLPPESQTSQLRHSLTLLMSKLLEAQPHFVRCIRSNANSEPNVFDASKVRDQIHGSGLVDCLEIRQRGYSHRFNFVDFLKSYCFLGFDFDERVVADAESCRLLLLRLNIDEWAIGKSKLFLRYYQVEYLSKLCEAQIKKIVFVQSCIRRWLAKTRMEKGMWTVAKQVVSVQKASKLWRKQAARIDGRRQKSDRKRSSWLRIQLLGLDELGPIDEIQTPEEKAAILIQSHVRGFIVRKKWGPILEARIREIMVTHTSKTTATAALQAEGLSEEEAAQVIQRYYRKWKTVSRQNSELDLNDKQSEKSAITLTWDAPFRLLEEEICAVRSGKKTDKAPVDLAAHLRDLITQGLASQEYKNELRHAKAIKGWKQVVKLTETEPSTEADSQTLAVSIETADLLGQKLCQLKEVDVSGLELPPLKQVDVSGPKLLPLKEVDISGPKLLPLKQVDVSGSELLPLKEVDISGPKLLPLKEVDISGPKLLPLKEVDISGPKLLPLKEVDISGPKLLPLKEVDILGQKLRPVKEVIPKDDASPSPDSSISITQLPRRLTPAMSLASTPPPVNKTSIGRTFKAKSFDVESSGPGLMDFRKLLRKTGHAPADL